MVKVLIEPSDDDDIATKKYVDDNAGSHPDLATHDALGLATDAELAGHDHDADYDPLGAAAAVAATLADVATSGDHADLTNVTVNQHHTEDHDHDGSPTQKLAQANTHQSPDTDTGTSSLHHTLGTGANQAAAGNDSRLSDSRAPTGSAGGELGGTFPNPTVDQDHAGEYTGGGTTFAVDNTNKDVLSVALTGLAAGDVLSGEAFVLYLNNSGSARTMSAIADLGGQSVTVADGATIGASATNRSVLKIWFSIWIESTSSVHLFITLLRGGPGAANTSVTAAGLSSIRDAWNVSASDLTGSKTLAIKIVSSAATTTQTAYVLGWRVRRAT